MDTEYVSSKAVFICAAVTLVIASLMKWRKNKLNNRKIRNLKRSNVNIGGIFGMDVGGTLTKIVYFEANLKDKDNKPASPSSPKNTETSTTFTDNLSEELSFPDAPSLKRSDSLNKLNQPDHQKALHQLYENMNNIDQVDSATTFDERLTFYSPFLGGRLHFLHFETKNMISTINKLSESTLTDHICTIGCTGGGAVKYAKNFQEELGITISPQDELSSLVTGMHFALTNIPNECYTYRNANNSLNTATTTLTTTTNTTTSEKVNTLASIETRPSSLERKQQQQQQQQTFTDRELYDRRTMREDDTSEEDINNDHNKHITNRNDTTGTASIANATDSNNNNISSSSGSIRNTTTAAASTNNKWTKDMKDRTLKVFLPLDYFIRSTYTTTNTNANATSTNSTNFSSSSLSTGTAKTATNKTTTTTSTTAHSNIGKNDDPSTSDELKGGSHIVPISSSSSSSSMIHTSNVHPDNNNNNNNTNTASTTTTTNIIMPSTQPITQEMNINYLTNLLFTNSNIQSASAFLTSTMPNLTTKFPLHIPLNLVSSTLTGTHSSSASSSSSSSSSSSQYIKVNNLLPYLVVNVGSGVSILKVTSPTHFERVSGSSVGGGTYWGLCRLLTHCTKYEEVLDMAENGDASEVDMLVRDIYGGDYDAMHLSGSMVASSFGKLVMKDDPRQGIKEEDLALALLMLITNNIGQVAYLNAKLHGCSKIFFVGNFLRHNAISCRRLAFAIDFWSKGEMEALFLAHEGYFGALGTFLRSAFGDDLDRLLSMELTPKPTCISSHMRTNSSSNTLHSLAESSTNLNNDKKL